MRTAHKLLLSLLFIVLSCGMFFAMHKTSHAAWEVTSISASPTAYRGYCNANYLPYNEYHGFAVNVSNLSFDVTTGTFVYTVNLKWSRCDIRTNLTRAYAIYGPASICPISGYYGENGIATDCVKYIGYPAYTPPSNLACGTATNAACLATGTTAAIMTQNEPIFAAIGTPPAETRSYALSFTIADWATVRAYNTSYSRTEQMCQYFKRIYDTIVLLPIVTGDSCADIVVAASWRDTTTINDYTPVGDLVVTPCSSPSDSRGRLTGWALDKDSPTEPMRIDVYDRTYVQGDENTSHYLGRYITDITNTARNTSLTTTYATSPAVTGPHDYNIDVTTHTNFNSTTDYTNIHVYAININASGIAGGTNVDLFAGATNTGNRALGICSRLYPWLQTTAGNVVANGQIIGQVSGSSTAYPGSRNPTDANKEAEFLIISKVGGGGPFCSRKNYILTNASATGGTNCGNGSGYSVLNTVSVAAGTGTNDKVVAGVKAAYDALPDACKTTTALVSGIPVPPALLATCPNGRIIKYTGTSLAGYSLAKGRVTILVEGDLTIDVGVGYGNTGYDKPKNVPNLAIVVKGNVTVLGAATLVGASIYATGTISTCDTAPTTFCSSQLVINGFLSAQSGFIFGRGFTDTTARTAAEIVNLTLQSVVYPPPGIDYSSVFKGDSSAKIDSSEYQPRF